MRTHLDLFSGIGGFSLAAEANGVRTVCQVEKDERCLEFLKKSWPESQHHDDIKTFDPTPYRGCWLVSAGVPCQPASRAGKQRGAADNRWLWPDAIRVFAAVRPAWGLFENPPGLGDVGLAGILSDLEAQGYAVRVFSIPACAVGAPHRRERYWIVCRRVADARQSNGQRRPPEQNSGSDLPGQRDQTPNDLERIGDVAHPGRIGSGQDEPGRGSGKRAADWGDDSGNLGQLTPDGCEVRPQLHGRNDGQGLEQRPDAGDMADAPERGQREHGSAPGDSGHPDQRDQGGMGDTKEIRGRTGLCDCEPTGQRGDFTADSGHWQNFVWLPCADGKVRRAPDDSFRLVDGLHRSLLEALGNSIVPQVASEIIKAMIAAESYSSGSSGPSGMDSSTDSITGPCDEFSGSAHFRATTSAGPRTAGTGIPAPDPLPPDSD